jgi:RND family efflux transporter MFP subunit
LIIFLTHIYKDCAALSILIRRTLPFVIIILFIGIAYKITQSEPVASKGKMKTTPKLVVETMLVTEKPFIISIDSFGVVTARTNSDLFALVSGQVMRVASGFESGGFFSEDDVLLEVDSADYEVAVQVANSNLANAELDLAEQNARFDQAQRDWAQRSEKKENETASDYALRLPQLRAAKANVETAQAQLKLAKLNLDRTKVRAPYNGRILEKFVDKGSVIGPNVKLAQIYATDAVEVRLPIANKDLNFIELPEASANAEELHPVVWIENKLTDPPEVWKGLIVRTEAVIDAASQQLYVIARIDNPFSTARKLARTPLKVGQYVSAKIQGKQLDNVVSIANSALYQGRYVYIVDLNDSKLIEQPQEMSEIMLGKIKRQPVDVYWRNKEVSVIGSGLRQGQHLVTTLLGQVTTGVLVEVDIKNQGDKP